MSTPFVLTDQTATVYIEGETFTVPRDWEGFDTLTTLISEGAAVADIKTHLGGYQQIPVGYANADNVGRVEITRRAVTYDGVAVHTTLARRMLDIASTGLPVDPWIKFMENLYENPADYARNELYEWLEKADLPITDDGHFLAYKRVSDSFKDIHTGTFDNAPGTVVTMPGGRPAVDSDRNQTCSTGLHFCSESYLDWFGNGEGSKVVLVKVNPKDVVSIPADHGNAKGRTWQYEVIQEVEGVLPAKWQNVVFTPADDQPWFNFAPDGNPVLEDEDYDDLFFEDDEEDWDEPEVDEADVEAEWEAYYAAEVDEDEADTDGSQPINRLRRLFGGKR